MFGSQKRTDKNRNPSDSSKLSLSVKFQYLLEILMRLKMFLEMFKQLRFYLNEYH